MPNFSSLACLEVPEKFLWVGGLGGWGGVVQSHFIVKPNHVLRLGWGFDNFQNEALNSLLKCKALLFLFESSSMLLLTLFEVKYIFDQAWLFPISKEFT